jgi:hypothetical protein
MNKYTIRRFETMVRVKRFILDHPFAPAIPGAAVLATTINTAIDNLQEHGGTQTEGFGTFRAGADERSAKAAELRETLRDLNKTARELDRDLFPGVHLQFRMPRSKSYQALLNAATAFHSAAPVDPLKQAFIDHGHAADFDVALAAKIAAVQAALLRKASGRQEQREGTAAQELIARNGMAAVRALGSIVNVRYRTADPALLEVWNAAARVENGPRTDEATPPAAAPAPASTPAATA